jgi:hypothetical protein
MKHVKLFEQFINEGNSSFTKDEVKTIKSLLTKETGFKNSDEYAGLPSLLIGDYQDSEVLVLFKKSIGDEPASIDNIEVDFIKCVSAIRGLSIYNPAEFKLMKQWAKKWDFKITGQTDNLYTNKQILPKDVQKMAEEFTDILVQAYGKDRMKTY